MGGVVSKIYEQLPRGPPLLAERHVMETEEQPSIPSFRLNAEQRDEVARSLRTSTLFKFCSDESISKIVDHVRREQFSEGEVLVKQADPQSRLFIVTKASKHHAETPMDSKDQRGMFSALHALRQQSACATTATETAGKVYTLESTKLNRLVDENPALAKEIIHSLSEDRFLSGDLMRPPMDQANDVSLLQETEPYPLVGATLGAVIESYYRSALTAWLNSRLTGTPTASMFPMFHVQIPARVIYVNGFKVIRSTLGKYVHPADYSNPEAIRLGSVIVPGLVMSPISSILEACNAVSNTESIYTRWIRGFVPRCGREITFGIGINQLSDAFEHKVTFIESAFLRTTAGSLLAGVVAGYVSHVPHNMSTLKLLQPHLSYREIVKNMVDSNLHRVSKDFRPKARRPLSTALTFLLPKGCLIRTTQICGSFMIINGTIHAVASRAIGGSLPQ